ncbi:hypothetical protein DFO67_11074 [Modicisalibacter xianhensis]|uniref:Uncharacterized protein n=1 Tax=Modicisalibacter xianhensis TaxID=442341 RepID=A0A4R8FW04_9GAMM|nr:hypothetical protein DFO67_11074 [Halomonas xianhensis]
MESDMALSAIAINGTLKASPRLDEFGIQPEL